MMPGTTRTRTRIITGPKGQAGRFGSSTFDESVVNSVASCKDVVGPGDCDPLLVEKFSVEGGRIHKPYTSSFAGWFENYLADGLSEAAQFFHLGLDDVLPADGDLATQTAARTNPSRPSMSVVTNILELGDIVGLMSKAIPGIIRDARRARRSPFRGGAKGVGNAHLLGAFGIAPVIRDLQALSKFQRTFLKRCAEVKRMQSNNGLRRTIKLGTYSKSSIFQKTVQSNWGGFVSLPFGVNTKIVVKGHARWFPGTTFSKIMTDGDMARRVRNAVIGLDVNLSSVWDGIPWSWLVDWAVDVGSYFRANLNIIPATLSGVQIMHHTTTTWEANQYRDGDLEMSSSKVTLERLSRKTVGVLPTAHFPLLSGSDMGILAALGTRWL